jgi:hypothetical protein
MYEDNMGVGGVLASNARLHRTFWGIWNEDTAGVAVNFASGFSADTSLVMILKCVCMHHSSGWCLVTSPQGFGGGLVYGVDQGHRGYSHALTD